MKVVYRKLNGTTELWSFARQGPKKISVLYREADVIIHETPDCTITQAYHHLRHMGCNMPSRI